MIDWLIAAAAAAASALLAAFTVRRILLLIAASLPRRTGRPSSAGLPSIAILIPARNEAPALDASLVALSRLDYPADRLFIVLIDDASMDDTRERFSRWAAGRPQTVVLPLATPHGKAVALNAGLAAAPPSDLVAICDSDLRPHPSSLRLLAAAFDDPEVAAAAPFLSPANAREGAVASYAAVETWVHQLVTSAGKDRLDLNPATNGASVYRRAAIEQLGGFPRVVAGEDISSTVALTREGHRTRFVREAVVDNTVVEGWKAYWNQHVRWSRNLVSSATAHTGVRSKGAPPARRIELVMQSAGYVDRLVLVAVVGFVAAAKLPVWLPLVYAGVLIAQIAVAVVKAGEARALPRFLLVTGAFYIVDVASSAISMVLHLLRRPRRWSGPPRRWPAPEGGLLE